MNAVCKSVADAADCAYSSVIITTKSVPEVVKTSTILAPLLSSDYTSKFPQPTYVFLQNGLNVEVDTYHAVKALGQAEPRIVSGALYIMTNLLAPNVVEHGAYVSCVVFVSSSNSKLYLIQDRLIMGVYRHENFTTSKNSPAEEALLKDLSDTLKAGGVKVSVVPEIQRHKFKKNIWNIAFSSIATLTRCVSLPV